MTKLRLRQHENEVTSIIVQKINELNEKYGFSAKAIAAKIRVSPETISRVSNNKEPGGRQLLGALEVLVELEEHKQEFNKQGEKLRILMEATKLLMGKEEFKAIEWPSDRKENPVRTVKIGKAPEEPSSFLPSAEIQQWAEKIAFSEAEKTLKKIRASSKS